MKQVGIYKIFVSGDERHYIGSSVDIHSRWLGHKSKLRCGNHHCADLQKAYDFFGESAFSYKVVFECSIDELSQLETDLIVSSDTPLFNTYRGATFNRSGMKMPASAKEAISESLIGNSYRSGIPHNDEGRKRISDGLKKAYRNGRKASLNPQNLRDYNYAIQQGVIEHPSKKLEQDRGVTAHYLKNWSLKEAGAAFGITMSAAAYAVERHTGKSARNLKKELFYEKISSL